MMYLRAMKAGVTSNAAAVVGPPVVLLEEFSTVEEAEMFLSGELMST